MNALDLFTKSGDQLNLRTDKGQRILFISRSGAGKTTAAVSFPKNIYAFDFDNRFRGAAPAIRWLGQEEFSKIDFDFYNPKDGFEAIDTKLNQIINLAEKNQCPYQTLDFASVGTLIYCLALDSQRKRGVPGAKGEFKGKIRGKVEFLHPDDYNYVSTALRLIMYNYIFPLNEMGINTLFSAWVSDKWGKKPGSTQYDPPEVIGEKILGPGNAVEEFMGYFDEAYYFRKEPPLVSSLPPKYTVEFSGPFAKTAYPLPSGQFDITGQNFFQFWKESIKKGMEKCQSL